MFQRRGKLACALQQTGAAVHFTRRFDQQIGQRRMQVRAGDELDRRRDQGQRLRRHVFGEIDRTHRQFALAQLAVAACISVGLREIHQTDTLRPYELAHDGWRGGVAQQHYAVDFAR